jgi:acetylornithine/succinyldiaminopimelate/putrescine aminotransferase
LAAPGLHRSFFCASGSEANEGAMLLAALATGRSEYVALEGGLHGRTKAAMSATQLDMWRTDPFPLRSVHRAPGPRDPESLPAIEKLLKKGTVAGLIAEPVQDNGGIVVPPDGYWAELRRLCTRHGTLLIADEVQTAWNRTGHWFATRHWGVTPDVITVAKALGNGFPIAAYLTTDELAAKYSRPGAATFDTMQAARYPGLDRFPSGRTPKPDLRRPTVDDLCSRPSPVRRPGTRPGQMAPGLRHSGGREAALPHGAGPRPRPARRRDCQG